MNATFKEFEIHVSDNLKRGTLPGRVFYRLCYKKAWDYFVDHESERPVLVHGIRGRLGNLEYPNGHAWVELTGGIVFDGVYQRFFQKKDYYKINKIIKAKKYPWSKKTFSLLLKDGTYGPWGAPCHS